MKIPVDILSVGAAVYDLIFSVDHHPAADEKTVASSMSRRGGGPAANAAITASRLGNSAAFAGYLGRDTFGDLHYDELVKDNIRTEWVVRGSEPTPLSVILVKPNGHRTVVNYRESTRYLESGSIDFSKVEPKVILFDGHEPHISLPLAESARQHGIPTILDAGSVHPGTTELASRVDYLVCTEKFSRDFTGEEQEEKALAILAGYAPNIVITLGERGLVWQNQKGYGRLPAFEVNAVDTTGAGDAFHGAFAACLSNECSWLQTLRFASAVAAICCTKMGARAGMPALSTVKSFLAHHESDFSSSKNKP